MGSGPSAFRDLLQGTLSVGYSTLSNHFLPVPCLHILIIANAECNAGGASSCVQSFIETTAAVTVLPIQSNIYPRDFSVCSVSRPLQSPKDVG